MNQIEIKKLLWIDDIEKNDNGFNKNLNKNMMSFYTGGPVSYQNLRTAMCKAAQEKGWKEEHTEKNTESYRLETNEKVKDFNYMEMTLRGGAHKVMVRVDERDSVENFMVFNAGLTRKKDILEFAKLVKKYIQ